MRYIRLAEILSLHDMLIRTSGGSHGLRDLGALQSAVAQPYATFDGTPLYPDLVSKAVTLCFSLVSNHPFIDGNKRIGHAAMEAMLMLNGLHVVASVAEQEELILRVAAGGATREELLGFVEKRVEPYTLS